MKLQATQENLSRALNSVARVASSRSTLPILSNVLVKTVDNRLCVAATDLNIAITHYIGTKISDSGAITVPARLMQDFVASLPPGVIDLTLEGTKLNIKTDRHDSTINGTSAEDFPIMPKIKKGTSWSVVSKDLKKALTQTAIAASHDEARPVLTGVNFHTENNHLYAVATDGYRLAEKQAAKLKEEISITVPASAINDLLRVIDDSDEEIQIINDDQQILFKGSDIELTTRLIDGSYPDYKKLIPEQFGVQAETGKKELIDTVKTSSLFARESAGSVVLEVEENNVNVRSIASQLGKNTAASKAKTKGTGQITLNARYMIDALGATDSEKVFIGFNGKLEPLVIKGIGAEDYTHVIMPLKS
ncbi:DNA polymerase III subunit beta [Candidatus Parcubacteria bacterium]|nr:DNA polymerase III subunit beta [Candidatus Parcubacteria bacterium]